MTMAQLCTLIAAENDRNGASSAGSPQPERGSMSDLLALANLGG